MHTFALIGQLTGVFVCVARWTYCEEMLQNHTNVLPRDRHSQVFVVVLITLRPTLLYTKDVFIN